MNMHEFIASKRFSKILLTILIIVVLLGVFQAGMWTGYHKASFSFNGGEKYFSTFGHTRDTKSGLTRGGSRLMQIPRDDFGSAHGTSGTVIKVVLPSVIVAGPDKVEREVTVTNKTLIRNMRNDVASTSLAVGDEIIVFGNPSKDGTVEAKLIRITK